MKQDTFILPHEGFIGQYDKVIIISVIGRTSYNANGQKTKPLGRVFGDYKSDQEISVDGLYDEVNQIIYLHLRGLYDTSMLLKNFDDLIEKCKSNNEEKSGDAVTDFHSIYNEVKCSYSRAMLFLFHVSHIIVVSHPGSTFDLSYVQMFKAIELARQKTASSVSEIIRSVPKVSTEWLQHRRFCTPRVVFYFENCPRQLRSKNGEISPSVKKLEHSIEDKIYNLLRKSKILSNDSSNSLFAIPLNQEFVYMNTEVDPTNDRLAHAVNSLLLSCQPGYSGPEASLEFTYSMNTDSNSEKRSFHKFLQVHTNHAFVNGFDDNYGRNISKAYFEMPNMDMWFSVTNKLYDYFCVNKETVMTCNKSLSVLNTETRFSDQRCLKVLPLAIARYQENLPPHYTKAYHETRLGMAMVVFANHARGPMFEKYSKQLIEECNQHFENGRQLCEYISLTGNPCTLPKHESDKEHCSGVRYIAACECGRVQGSREDPYSVCNANYTFYSDLAERCCSRLERIKFPVFEPSTKEFRAANLLINATINEKVARIEEVLSQDKLSDISSESDMLEQTKSGISPTHQTSEGNNTVLEFLDDQDKDKNLIRQPSTTEYLPGMLTSISPAGLLPQFPSWSLVCLGPSSLYSHNLGLSESQHIGFLANTNFLLPWDVTIRSSHNKGWPTVNDGKKYQYNNPMNRCPQRKPKILPGGAICNDITVKVFVGIEYECPRGHRFMMSSPDKVLRATAGIVKESGHKVTNSDMPLYYNCPCRPSKPLVAQLMRIHVVSPKNLVYITLNPKIQPGTGAPIYVTGFDKPIKLTQSTYWILRLPYVYVRDGEPFLPPINAPPTLGPHSARLLQGMWGVVEMD